MVVYVYFMLDAPHKQRLHLSPRSPSLGNCFYCKAAVPQKPEANYTNATEANTNCEVRSVSCEVSKQDRKHMRV